MNLYKMTSRTINIRKVLTAIILFFTITNVLAQEESQGDPYQYNPSEKMFLPTPEQATLLKFIDIPTGSYTGVQGYSVPIYTVQGKAFSLPISIDYHGMGIKVNEVSSSVGIGWTLNLGGITLSEEVRGERDLQIGNNRLEYFNPYDFQPISIPSPGNDDYRNGLAMLALSPGTHGYTPTVELHPDYYSYSLLNNSGKFMLDNNNKPHTIPKDNVKIIGIQKLIDSKGLIYYFSVYKKEDAIYGNGQNNYGGIVENRKSYGYKIDSIRVPHTDELVKFNYHQVSYTYFSSHTVTNKVYFSQAGNSMVIHPSGSNTIGTVTEYIPATIEYNNLKVEFKYKMNGSQFLGREDLDGGGARLEFIEIKDNATGIKIKDYKINTDYFTSANESIPSLWHYPTTSRDALFKRLKLNSIQELINNIKYEFEYFGEAEQQYLPPRFSYKTDFWGMYNGKNNTSEIGEYAVEYSGKKYYLQGADKNPDLNFARIGTLKKVFLPTGGYQEFEYELDEFDNRMFEDNDNDFHPVHNYQEREFFLDTSSGTVIDQYLPISVPSPDYREGFDYKITFYYPCNPNNGLADDDLPLAGTKYYQLELYKGTTKIAQFFKDGTFPVEQLVPGSDYYLKIVKFGNPTCPETGNIPPSSIYVKFTWIHDYITNPLNRNAGTLRTKSITLKDKAGKPLIKKSYSYQNFDKPEFSSGHFTGRNLELPYISYEEGKGFVYNLTNNDIYNLTSSFGKSVVYKHVKETYESTDSLQASENHSKEYIFSLSGQAGYPARDLPLSPYPYNDYMGGLMLEEKVKNNQNKIVKITKNQYNLENPDFFFNSFSANYYSPYNFALSPALVISMGNQGLEDHPFSINFYHITSGWIKLLRSDVEEYENNTLVRSNYTEYAYNENTGSQNEFKSILPVSKITGTSLKKDTYEEKIKTVYKYPQDLVGVEQNSSMQQLISANMISDPVVTETYLLKPGTETKLSELHFKYNGILPSEVHFRNGTGTINLNTATDRKVRYSQYDSKGNILEYIMEDGTPVSIVWGYQGQYPVAKVEGISYAELQSINNPDNPSVKLVDAIRTYADADNDHCMGIVWGTCNESNLRVKLNQLRFHTFFDTTPAAITTYTYDPLLGITSMTQPNGQTEYYSYDAAGRLDEVYIMETENGYPVKRVLKKNKYNYQP